MPRKFVSVYALLMGLCMMLMWTFFLFSGSVPELDSRPIEILFHLFAEFSTAIVLIISAILSLKSKPISRSLLLVALGMLLYTLMVSPGYYTQLNNWGFVGMFSIFLVLGIIAIVELIRTAPSSVNRGQSSEQ